MGSPPPKQPSLLPPPPPQTEFTTPANPPAATTTAPKDPTMDYPPALSKTPLSQSESPFSTAGPSAPPTTTLEPNSPPLLPDVLPAGKDPISDVQEPILLPIEGEEMPGVGPAMPIPPTPRQVPSSALPQPASPPFLSPDEGEDIPGVGPAIPIPPTPKQVASSALAHPASPVHPAAPVPVLPASPVHPAAAPVPVLPASPVHPAATPESDSDSDSGCQDWGDFFDCWG